MALIKVINGQKHIIAEKNITDHNKLVNRDVYGCHPISAIRGLPEKITDLKTKDTELETKIDELTQKINIAENNDIPNVESSMTEKIDNAKVQARKIDIVENSDNTFTFTNYGAESSKTIQAGFLPDNDTITLTDDKKVTLNKVYTYPQFVGDGTKGSPISILTDPQTIVPNSDNVLQAIGVHAGVDGVLLSGEYIYNEFTELNKDIGDLTNQINSDFTNLTNKDNEQDQKIIKLQNKALGIGGYLTAYNFKKATPTQTELTKYAKQQLGLTDETKISDQTRVKNLYDNVVWILNNHSIDSQATFNWVSNGKDVVSLASNTEAGIVLGSNEDYQGSIDVNGHISINGLAEYIARNDTEKENINNELSKHGINQSYENSDGTTIIRNGNIVMQYATFNVPGNSEKIFSFPVSYDSDKKPMCWCNSVAQGLSVDNSAAVINWDSNAVTIRTCGVDTFVTIYVIGWKTK